MSNPISFKRYPALMYSGPKETSEKDSASFYYHLDETAIRPFPFAVTYNMTYENR